MAKDDDTETETSEDAPKASPKTKSTAAKAEAAKAAAGPGSPKKVQYLGDESILERLLPHVKKIAVGGIALAVVLSGYFFYRAHVRSNEAEATTRYAKVNELATRTIEVPPPARTSDDPTQPPPPAPTPDPDHPTYPDRAARAAAVLAGLQQQGATASHGYKGGFLLDAGKYDEAVAEYKAGAAGDDIDAVLCREGIGLALEAKALSQTDATQKQSGLQAALAAFQAEQADAAGPRYGYALYHQARVQETLGKVDDAKALYEKVKTADDHKTELSQLVAKRLANLGAS